VLASGDYVRRFYGMSLHNYVDCNKLQLGLFI